jgi:hypothetical protein
MEVLALLFVISAGCIALAIILPIALAHEHQAATVRQARATNGPLYTVPIRVPMSAVYQMRPIPPPMPRRVILERWVYA